MTDISMCGSTDCPMRRTCRRNEASGTKPSEFRQSWFMEPPIRNGECEHYWPCVPSASDVKHMDSERERWNP